MYFFLQQAYELLSQSRKLKKWEMGGGGKGGLKNFKKFLKNKRRGRLLGIGQ